MLGMAPVAWGAVYGGVFTLWQVEVLLLLLLPVILNAVLGYLAGGTIYYRYTSTKSD